MVRPAILHHLGLAACAAVLAAGCTPARPVARDPSAGRGQSWSLVAPPRGVAGASDENRASSRLDERLGAGVEFAHLPRGAWDQRAPRLERPRYIYLGRSYDRFLVFPPSDRRP